MMASDLTGDFHPLILAGQPDAASRKLALAAAGDLPHAVLALLDWDEDPEVRIAAAAARKDGGDRSRVFARLAFDPVTATHSALRANARWVPDYVLPHSRLWTDPRIRAAVARYTSALELLGQLAHDSSPEVRGAAALNGRLPDSQLRLLSEDRDSSVAKIAAEQIGSRKRHVLDRVDSGASRRWTFDAAGWSLVVHEVLNLSASRGDQLLADVARAAVKLGEHGAYRVLRQPWVPAEVLRGLGTARRQRSDVLKAVASNPNTPADVLRLFAQGRWGYEAESLALANPGIDISLLEALATNQVPRDKRLDDFGMAPVWSNPALPEALLHSVPTGSGARRGLASNPAAPASVLSELAQDPHLVGYIAGNPATPAATLLEVAQRSSNTELIVGVGRSLVCNPATPRAAFESLLQHRDAEVRACLAIPSSHTPLDILSRLATDTDAGVREAVASHPNTPQATIDSLTSCFHGAVPVRAG